MPNYDLGKAHGKIVIDTDKRGADDADKALSSMAKTVQVVESKLKSFERVLNNLERELESVAERAHRADKALDDLDGGFVSVHSSSTKATRSTHDFNAELSDLVYTALKAKRAFDTLYRPFDHFYQSYKGFQNANGVGGFAKATSNFLLLGAAMGAIKNKMLGVNKVIENMPTWQRNIVNFAAKTSAAVLAIKGFERYGGAIKRVAGHFGILNTVIEKTGHRFGVLGKQMDFASYALGRGTSGIRSLTKQWRNFLEVTNGAAGGAARSLIGFGVAGQGLAKLRDQFSFITKGGMKAKLVVAGVAAAIASIGPLAEIGASTLRVFSNALNFTLNAGKQLAGGILALPGLYATVGTTILGIIPIAKTLGRVLGDVMSAKTPEDFNKALEAVPEKFKALAISLNKAKNELTKMSETMTEVFVDGLDKKIDSLVENLKGPLSKGLNNLAVGYRGVVDKLFSFASDQSNVSDFSLALGTVRQTIDNIGNALTPLLTGFKDLVIVGMQFTRDWSVGAERLTQQFANWANLNRQNGNLRKWMDDGLAGAKDLTRGLVDLGKALWKIMDAFATDTGDNALQRFADQMERFNKAVDQSKATGFLKDFSGAVKGMGFDQLKNLVGIIKDLYNDLKVPFTELYKAAEPFFKQVGEGFRDVIVPAIQLATQIVESFFNAVQGFGPLTGWVLGSVAGFKLLWKVIAPFASVGKIFAGFAIGTKGLSDVLLSAKMLGFAKGLDALTKSGDGASNMLTGISSKIENFSGKVAGVLGPLAAAAAAIALLYGASSSQNTAIDEFNANLKESAKNAQEFKEALKGAFLDDNGAVGKTVMDTINSRISQSMAETKTLADQQIGWWQNLQASFDVTRQKDENQGFFGSRNPFAQGKEFNDLQKATQDARQAQEAFDRLGLTTQDLSGIVTGTQSSFDNFQNALRGSGDGGNEAAAQLQGLRDVFNQAQADFAKAGPGGVQLANAIEQIADAGGDATTKLQGLNSALQALGLNKTSEIENAFAYADALKQIGEDAANLVNQAAPLDDIWNGTGPGGLNTASENAENLFQSLSGAVEKFRQAAVDTGDVAGEFQKLQAQVPQLAAAFTPVGGNVDDTTAKIQNLITILGGVPDIVSIFLQVKGGDKIGQDLAKIVASIKANPNAEINIPISADPKQLQTVLDNVLGPNSVYTKTDGNIITIDVAKIPPGAWAPIDKALAEHGIQVAGGPPPAEQPTITPKVETPELPPGVDLSPQEAASRTPAAPQAAAPVATPDTTQIDAAKQKIADLEAQIKTLSEQKAAPQVDTTQIDELKKKVDELVNSLSGKEIKIQVNMDSAEAVVQKLQQINAALSQSVMQWNAYQNSVGTVMGNIIASVQAMVNQVSSLFSGLAANAYASGSQVGNAFAEGLRSTIANVAGAASQVAQTVNDYIHGRSPTKKGPLSGQGWSYYSGQKLVGAFTQGIGDGQDAAAKASAGVAGGVGSSLQGPYDIGRDLGRLGRLVDFGSKMVDIFSQVSDTIFQAAKFMADPLGKGTFFGQKYYDRDPGVSDRELERKREDDLQNRLQSAASGAVSSAASQAVKDQKDAEKAATGTGTKGTKTTKTPEEIAADKIAAKNAKNAAKDIASQTLSKDDVIKSIQDEMAAGYDNSVKDDRKWTAEDLAKIQDNTSYSAQTQDQMLSEFRKSNGGIDSAINVLKDQKSDQGSVIDALHSLDTEIQTQKDLDTPASRQMAQSLESIRSDGLSTRGLSEQNPIDSAQNIAGGAANVAKDVFASIKSVLDSIGAAKEIGDTLVRGVENSEDVMKLIDNFQSFITTAAQIASAVSSGIGIASSLASSAAGADPSGGASGAATGLAAASQIASLISAGLSTVNGIIDLAQEAYSIAGSYFGDFLGYLVGGAGGQLMGDVKFLLDENDGTLKAWSKDNPEDKRTVGYTGFGGTGTTETSPRIGELNVYGGVGQDPRDLTNEMMFAVSAASSGVSQYD